MCETMGMELASFQSLAEMTVVLQKFQNYQPQPGEQAPLFPENIWIGMTKGFSGMDFKWGLTSNSYIKKLLQEIFLSCLITRLYVLLHYIS